MMLFQNSLFISESVYFFRKCIGYAKSRIQCVVDAGNSGNVGNVSNVGNTGNACNVGNAGNVCNEGNR